MSYPEWVLARLYGHIEPYERGSRYEEPLQAALEAAGAGTVTGGGSLIGEAGEIEFADLEIELTDLGPALDVAVSALERAGAPQGSEIIHGDDVLREFGSAQCVAIYLDGISLPDDVYENLDFDQVVESIAERAGPDSYRGFWQGPEATGIYFCGADAEDLFARVEPLLRELPIGQNARVVIRHGRESLQPRPVQLPRHGPSST